MKDSKQAARYTPQGTKQEHCGICAHFEPPHSCEVVAGSVVEGGWCRHFRRKGSVRDLAGKAYEARR